MLTKNELNDAKKIISKTPVGRYVLRNIYGEEKWGQIQSPRVFGKRFKQSVSSGSLTGITYEEKQSDNAAIYKVE